MKVKIAVLLFYLFCVTFSYGQQNSDSATIRFNNWILSADSILPSLQLDTLRGKIQTLYTKGHKLRAQTIQSLVEHCVAFYEQKLPKIKFTVQLVILDKTDWNKLAIYPPYGMPNNVPKMNRIFIAADKKAVGKLFGQTDTLPDNELSDFDYIVLHELGHNFFLRLNNTDTKKSWANEFLASYFAICYLKDSKSKKGLPQIDQTNFQPQHKTLEDFDNLYSEINPQNYAWYQGKFQELGYKLYTRFGITLIKDFIDNFKTNGKNLDPITLLKQLAPDITKQFLEQMK